MESGVKCGRISVLNFGSTMREAISMASQNTFVCCTVDHGLCSSEQSTGLQGQGDFSVVDSRAKSIGGGVRKCKPCWSKATNCLGLRDHFQSSW
eukprot:399519-Karenia_brevis.AAC.1